MAGYSELVYEQLLTWAIKYKYMIFVYKNFLFKCLSKELKHKAKYVKNHKIEKAEDIS